MGLFLSHSPREVFADLDVVTLADEDTNSILADNANRTFQGNVSTRVIQVIQVIQVIISFYTGRFKLVEPTNASGAIWWPNLELMQVAFYLAGEIFQVIDSVPWVRCASGNVWLLRGREA